jgi:ABC-type sugar transport system substrate-binding protein
MKDLTTDKRVASALAVMTVNPKIRAFLEANDPKALEQAERALKAANEDPKFDFTC